MTAEDSLQLPDGGFRYELIRGELVRRPLPGFRHGRIANRIAFHLTGHVEALGLGIVVAAETGFLLHTDPDEVRGADVAFISRSRYEAAKFNPEKHFPGAPDMVVEVVSPSDSYGELEEKFPLWLRAGARLVVAADPRKRLFFVHRPDAAPEILGPLDTLHGDPVVPGWEFRVGEAFPEETEAAR